MLTAVVPAINVLGCTSHKREFYGAFCGFEGFGGTGGTAGLALMYSRTKICKILLRFWMLERSRFCSLSSNVCHTEGKGDGMRWRIRTPDREPQDGD